MTGRFFPSGALVGRPPKPKPNCSIEGCEKVSLARGVCGTHYARLMRTGTTGLRPAASPSDRFWAKVDKNGNRPADHTLAARGGPCWIWTGRRVVKRPGVAYGSFCQGSGNYMPAHRFAYADIVGPIPDGLVIDHRCEETLCVNPAHLEPVTNAENTRRAFRARRVRG